ncbi:MAG: DUF1697 domain-containing protein [Proteobacteria bacterium]|nr:DUF1697 domain-containing protein [Pseudomonadota bacterium]MBU1714338.1 DUF1697 domain-containing protein [Pseudomonadota bacterium]
MRYAALLRGVNVGKSVKVPMASLRSLIENIGFRNVATYLNSGNVIFDSELPKREIESSIEESLAKLIGQKIPVLVKSSSELDLITNSIPAEWQNDDLQKTDVAYLFKEADNEKTLVSLPVRREFPDVRYVEGALFWNVSRKNYNKSQLNKIIGHVLYEKMTIRNINTARQLARLTNP